MDKDERHDYDPPMPVPQVYNPAPLGIRADRWPKDPHFVVCHLDILNVEKLIEWLRSTGKTRIKLDVTSFHGELLIKENTWVKPKK